MKKIYVFILTGIILLVFTAYYGRMAIRMHDRNTNSISSLKQLAMIMKTYAEENNGKYPESINSANEWSENTLDTLLEKWWAGDYREILEYHPTTIRAGPDVIFILDKVSGNAIYADGHVDKYK